MRFCSALLLRIAWALPVVLLVSFLGFTLMRYPYQFGPWELQTPMGLVHVLDSVKNPNDPLVALRQNPQISPEALAKETKRLGLDRPFLEQYTRWLQAVLRNDWGTTLAGDQVVQIIVERAGNTLLLNSIVFLLTWLVALPLGIVAATSRWWDGVLWWLGNVLMATPTFLLALLGAMWVVQTGWLPYGGVVSAQFTWLSPWGQLCDVASHLALPVLVLTIGGFASLQRQMRGTMLETLGSEYVRSARARGLSERRVVYRHAARTALNPLITLLGYEFSGLLSGALLTETVLAYPGLGLLMYQAVLESDTNLVMASLVLSCVLLLLGNFLADCLLAWSDPRLRRGMGHV